ncbi:MAG: tetratricopeptide repeat protein [Spirochaetales bacterium]|nr:tetratricopeptide repeat protein [Leptospiraceae bacterium]MCP5481753.1 tetratricopeptide repeat protein [Spirochaetales bacterium]
MLDRFSILLSCCLLAGVPACRLFQPAPEISQAQQSRPTRIQDPVRYEAAREQVNQANRLFLRGDLPGALNLANQSLETHETFEGYYLKGTILYRQGKAEESIREFEKAEEFNPDDQQLLLTMGTVYTALGDLDAAQQRYLTLHNRYPDDAVYAYKVGTTYKNLRDYERAYIYLQKADQPDFEYLDQVYLQLGDVCLELKKYDESRSYFERARAQNPNLPDAAQGGQASQVAQQLDQGNAAYAAGRFDEALRFYEEAKRIAPNQAIPYLLTGSALLGLERGEEAKQNILKAVELDPRNPRGYSLLGAAYHQLGDYRRAVETYETGLEIAPENYEILNRLGLVYRDRDELRKAIDSFSRAAEIKPDYLPARRNLAFALLDDKRYDEARRQFEAASSLAPEDQDLQRGVRLVEIYQILDRGDRFFSERKLDEAVAEYNRALQIDANEPAIHNAIGRAELERRRYPQAEAQFKASLEADPNNVAALQGLLRVYSAQRRRADEQSTLTRLQELTRNDLTAAITLGRIKEDAGELAEAERYYLGLLEQNPESAELKARLGYVYYKMGLEENSRERYPQALTLFEKAETYNDQIPQLPDTLRIVRENIEYAAELPRLREAERLFTAGRFREALPIFESVYERLKRPLILVKIANCHVALGNEERGMALLEEAQQSGAETTEISEAIYNHMLRRGRVDQAEAGFNSIIASNQEAYYSHYKLGVIRLMRKEYAPAIEFFDRALVYKPDFTPAYLARGVAFYGTGETDRARREFEEALRRDREDVLASFNLGVFFFNEEMLDQAKSIFTDLVAAAPDFADARYQLSYIYFQAGDLDQAEEHIRRCIDIKEDARYYYALSLIREKRYEAQRTPDNAASLREAYQEVVNRFPDSPFAQDSRQKLLTIMPDTRLVQPYRLVGPARNVPILFNGMMLVPETSRLVSLDISSKRQRWAQPLPGAPVGIVADTLVHVLVPNALLRLDPATGQVLDQTPVSGNATALVGSYGRMGIVTEEGGKPTLRMRGSEGAGNTGEAGTRFAFAGGAFLRVDRAGNRVTVTRLGADLSAGESASLDFRNLRSDPELSVDRERLCIFAPGERLVVLNPSDLDSAAVDVPAGTAFFALDDDDHVYLPSARQMRVVALGETDARVVNLPQPMLSQASFQVLPEGEGILYIGSDRYVRRVDLSGTEVWKEALPRAAGAPAGSMVEEAFSLYH